MREYNLWQSKFCDGAQLAFDALGKQKIVPCKSGSRVFVFGMGGSAAAGKLIETMLHHRGQFAFKACDPFEPHEIPTADDLIIFISHSGNTWEIVGKFIQLKATLARRLVITCGGTLLKMAQNNNVHAIVMPETDAQPREDISRFLGILSALSERINLLAGNSFVADFKSFIQQAVDHVAQNGFEDLKPMLESGHPETHLWGVSGDTSTVVYRCQAQLNEHSKLPTLATTVPEAAHNVVEGFSWSEQVQNRFIILLQTDFVDPRVKCAVKMLSKTVKKRGAKLYSPSVFGDTWERQLLYLVIWSDFASFWLGLEQKIDPRSTDVVGEVKQMISNECNF